MNDLDYYQKRANTFINYQRYESKMDYLLNTALGLTGESGEFADIIKKVRYHGHPLDEATKEKLRYELGDVLWYLAEGCLALDTTLCEIAEMNIEKLTNRHKGTTFSEEASLSKEKAKNGETRHTDTST